MKKLYLPLLLFALLGFANAYEVPTYKGVLPGEEDYNIVYDVPSWVNIYGYGIGVSSYKCCKDEQLIPDGKSGIGWPYTIHNKLSEPIAGFKFYHYFNAPPSQHFDVQVYHYFYANRTDRGAIYADEKIQPKSIKIERLSAVQYRAVLDYSNISIASRQRFPAGGAIYIRVISTDNNGARLGFTNEWTYTSDWVMPGHELIGFAIESTGGEVMYGPELNKKGTRVHPIIDDVRRIGLLSSESRCPDYGLDSHPLTSYLTISIDDEDTDTRSGFVDGDPNPLGVTLPGTFVSFRFCPMMLDQMPIISYDYAVLKLDSECPYGSYPVKRFHDVEDEYNRSYSSHISYVWPNVVDRNVTMEYCFVPGDPSSARKFPFDRVYGVYGNPGPNVSPNIAHTEVYVDDEDKGNINSWDLSGVPSVFLSRVQNIMSGTKNTTYHVIKWTKNDGAMLTKSANNAIADDDNAVEKTLVAAAPLAPAIKGLNRVAVAVELKSFGDAKISVVDVKGSKIAQVVEKNLQPGVHPIKWNSGMVPSGRYIVKIEQNGMVNAKNVILK